jgi:hypothetical protein
LRLSNAGATLDRRLAVHYGVFTPLLEVAKRRHYLRGKIMNTQELFASALKTEKRMGETRFVRIAELPLR